MKVTAERIPEAQMLLEIELEDAQVKKSLDQAARRLSQRFRIPGFRQGKAPRRVVERALGADAVFEEAAERLIPQALTEALEQEDLDPVAQPSIEVTGREPVTFTATIPLPPVVELGDYQGISIAKPESEFSEEMVEERLLELRRQHAVLEPVEREPGARRFASPPTFGRRSTGSKSSTSPARSSTCARAPSSACPASARSWSALLSARNTQSQST